MEVKGKVVKGATAVQHHLDEALKKKEANTLKLEDLEQLTKFGWLMDARGTTALSEMMTIAMVKTKIDLDAAVQRVGAHKRALDQCDGDGAASSSSKKSSVAKPKVSEASAAMAMFRGV